MTTTSGTSSTTQSTSILTGSAGNRKASQDMDKDTFLKLLVAQMKYQDPSKPVDSSQFMAQTAQFSMVEKLGELASSQLMFGVSSMVGRTVTYTGDDGAVATGVVTSATVSGSNPILRVGNKDVPLSSVREVKNTAG